MSAINTLIVEAKNKLDEIQEAVGRRPEPPVPSRYVQSPAAEWLYKKWEPIARQATGERQNVDTWIEQLVEARGELVELKAALKKPRASKALKTMSEARKEVLVILGAKKGEGTRAAARRVMRQLKRAQQAVPALQPNNAEVSVAIAVYNELDAEAIRAGWAPGSVGAYVRGLRKAAKK